jgi:hypothetical protein
MALTKFSDVYQAKSDSVRGRVGTEIYATRHSSLAGELASAGAVHETDEQALRVLQSDYSISTIEEIVALADVAERKRKRILKDLPISPQTVQGLVRAYTKSDLGKLEIADWKRYERFKYQLGCEIDLESPPPDEPPGITLGAGGAGLPPGGEGAAHVVMSEPRSINLIDLHMAPIRDQANRGTCVAFTSVACLEYHHHRYSGLSDLNLSEQHAYWRMVTQTGMHNLQAMLPILRDEGVCTERTWPYFGNQIPGDDAQGPPPPLAASESPAFSCQEVLQLPPRSVPDLRRALASGRLVGIGIPVYSSWYDSKVVRKHGNITVPLPGEVPQKIGHAVTLVGYEDNLEYAGGGFFIVRNSWGRNWSTAGYLGPGYGTIPYRYIEGFNWDAWYIAN